MAERSAPPFLSGVILAAGGSSRMGRPKQLLPLGNRCLLEHVLDEAAASCLDELILVLGHSAPEIQQALRLPSHPRIRITTHLDPDQGLASSLGCGLAAVDRRAVAAAVLLGDQPGVTASHIDQVARAFLAGAADAARPVYADARGGRVPGHPVFLARGLWPELEALRGDEGARRLLESRPGGLLEVPMKGDPPADIDTPDDYQQIVEAARMVRPEESDRSRG